MGSYRRNRQKRSRRMIQRLFRRTAVFEPLEARVMLTGSQTAFFSAPQELSAQDHLDMTPVDLDGDGDLDLLTSGPHEITWQENLGAGVFEGHVIANAGKSNRVLAADLNNDGHIDVLTMQLGLGVRWYENTGNDTDGYQNFDTSHLIAPHGSSSDAMGLAVADIDDDGDLDVMATPWRSVEWYENPLMESPGQNGVWLSHTAVPGDRHAPSGLRKTDLQAADIDGDGDMDLVSGNAQCDIHLYKSNQAQADVGEDLAFEEQFLGTAQGVDGARVHLVDMDQDTDLDVLVLHGGTIEWYENEGTGQFLDQVQTPHFVADIGVNAPRIAPVDADNDGDIDIFKTETTGQTVTWFQNDGQQNFDAFQLPEPTSTATLAVGDVDGDGDPDVITEAYPAGIEWLSNQHVSIELLDFMTLDVKALTFNEANTNSHLIATIDELTVSPGGILEGLDVESVQITGAELHTNSLRLDNVVITLNGTRTATIGETELHELTVTDLQFTFTDLIIPTTEAVDAVSLPDLYRWDRTGDTTGTVSVTMGESQIRFQTPEPADSRATVTATSLTGSVGQHGGLSFEAAAADFRMENRIPGENFTPWFLATASPTENAAAALTLQFGQDSDDPAASMATFSQLNVQLPTLFPNLPVDALHLDQLGIRRNGFNISSQLGMPRVDLGSFLTVDDLRMSVDADWFVHPETGVEVSGKLRVTAPSATINPNGNVTGRVLDDNPNDIRPALQGEWDSTQASPQLKIELRQLKASLADALHVQVLPDSADPDKPAVTFKYDPAATPGSTEDTDKLIQVNTAELHIPALAGDAEAPTATLDDFGFYSDGKPFVGAASVTLPTDYQYEFGVAGVLPFEVQGVALSFPDANDLNAFNLTLTGRTTLNDTVDDTVDGEPRFNLGFTPTVIINEVHTSESFTVALSVDSLRDGQLRVRNFGPITLQIADLVVAGTTLQGQLTIGQLKPDGTVGVLQEADLPDPEEASCSPNLFPSNAQVLGCLLVTSSPTFPANLQIDLAGAFQFEPDGSVTVGLIGQTAYDEQGQVDPEIGAASAQVGLQLTGQPQGESRWDVSASAQLNSVTLEDLVFDLSPVVKLEVGQLEYVAAPLTDGHLAELLDVTLTLPAFPDWTGITLDRLAGYDDNGDGQLDGFAVADVHVPLADLSFGSVGEDPLALLQNPVLVIPSLSYRRPDPDGTNQLTGELVLVAGSVQLFPDTGDPNGVDTSSSGAFTARADGVVGHD